MRWIIEDTGAHALAKRLAHQTGESLTGAVKHAVREKLARLETTRGDRALADELDDIALRCADLPRRDGRHADEIVSYDDDGLPA